MKKITCLAVVLVALAGVSHAGGFSVGGHGAYTLGGDIESEEFGYGAQVGIDLVDRVSLELSGTMFSDEVDAEELGMMDVDARHIALSARFDIPVNDTLLLYVGGGISYNMIEADEPAVAEVVDSMFGDGVAEDFINGGGTIEGGMDIDIDDAIGYHLCTGVSLALSDSVELFGEYRFTWLDIEGELDINITAMQGGVVQGAPISQTEKIEEGSFDFGLARVGINILL